MKYLFTAITLLFSLYLQAQTITSASLPKVGSEHSYFTSLNTDYLEISKTGSGQIWDISGVSGGNTEIIKYENPASGQYNSLYPTATFFVNEGGGAELYYQSDASGLKILGSPSESFFNPGNIDKGFFNPPIYTIQTPMNLNQQLNQNSYTTLDIPISIIPDSLLNTLPVTPDSLRLKVNTNYDYVCTGSGILKCPGRDFTVLQQIANVTSTFVAEAKVPFFGWIDISAFIDFGFNGNTSSQFITYWSPDEEGYVAQFQWDAGNGQFNMARYTTNGTILEKAAIKTTYQDPVIYPNPGSGLIYFDHLVNNSPTNILIMDALGNGVLEINEINRNSVDISSLPDGIYFVRFTTEGLNYFTRKLIKL